MAIFGENGVFLYYAAANFLSLFVLFIMACIRKRRLAVHLDDYLNLTPEMEDEKDVLELSAHNIEEVVEASEKIHDFAAKYGADPKKVNLLTLAAEEMGGNVVAHNANRHKKLNIEFRAAKKEDHWMLRIRDDGKVFNPERWASIHHNEDPTKNIGIRMISKAADEFRYINIQQMNNLIVKIK